MPRFLFNLDAVLDDRRRKERDRQLVVARIERQRVAIEQRVKTIQDRLVSERGALRDQLRPGQAVAIDQVRYQMSASIHGIVELRRTAIELAGTLKRLESARADLLRAAIDRKAVEKLRERRLERWKREQAHREAAELDDLTLMRRAAIETETDIGVTP